MSITPSCRRFYSIEESYRIIEQKIVEFPPIECCKMPRKQRARYTPYEHGLIPSRLIRLSLYPLQHSVQFREYIRKLQELAPKLCFEPPTSESILETSGCGIEAAAGYLRLSDDQRTLFHTILSHIISIKCPELVWEGEISIESPPPESIHALPPTLCRDIISCIITNSRSESKVVAYIEWLRSYRSSPGSFLDEEQFKDLATFFSEESFIALLPDQLFSSKESVLQIIQRSSNPEAIFKKTPPSFFEDEDFVTPLVERCRESIEKIPKELFSNSLCAILAFSAPETIFLFPKKFLYDYVLIILALERAPELFQRIKSSCFDFISESQQLVICLHAVKNHPFLWDALPLEIQKDESFISCLLDEQPSLLSEIPALLETCLDDIELLSRLFVRASENAALPLIGIIEYQDAVSFEKFSLWKRLLEKTPARPLSNDLKNFLHKVASLQNRKIFILVAFIYQSLLKQNPNHDFSSLFTASSGNYFALTFFFLLQRLDFTDQDRVIESASRFCRKYRTILKNANSKGIENLLLLCSRLYFSETQLSADTQQAIFLFVFSQPSFQQSILYARLFAAALFFDELATTEALESISMKKLIKIPFSSILSDSSEEDFEQFFEVLMTMRDPSALPLYASNIFAEPSSKGVIEALFEAISKNDFLGFRERHLGDISDEYRAIVSKWNGETRTEKILGNGKVISVSRRIYRRLFRRRYEPLIRIKGYLEEASKGSFSYMDSDILRRERDSLLSLESPSKIDHLEERIYSLFLSSEEESTPLFQEIISLLEDPCFESLRTIKDDLLRHQTRLSQLTRGGVFTAVNSNSFDDLLCSGEEVFGSCQAINARSDLALGLLGTIADPYTRILAVKQADGKIIARSLIRLLFIKGSQTPCIFLEKFYDRRQNTRLHHLDLIRREAEAIARFLGIPLFQKASIYLSEEMETILLSEEMETILEKPPCPDSIASVQYVDGAGGLVDLRKGYTIRAERIC